MNRRNFSFHLAAAAAGFALPALAQPNPWRAIEAGSGGRMGIAVLQADGRIEGNRLDERFPMCSTFKWVAAAHVLQRVDRGQEKLDRVIRYTRKDLLRYAPVAEKHVDAGMTVAQLCEAAVALSDNTAANLLLASFGGPQGLTAFARGLGDKVTRLDRWEPALNEARPGDPRDTTSPRAMAGLLHAALLGNGLSEASRKQLAAWLEATQTNQKRLRADLPAGWRMGSKTGTGARGTTNDVGIFWPPQGKPIIVVTYLTTTKAPEAEREGAIAAVARRVTSAS